MDNYAGSSHLGDAILQDINRWSGQKQQEINTAARRIRNEMRPELETVTPVRNYPHNNGVVMRITVHRIGSGKKARRAKREALPDEFQPGAMRSGWINATLKSKQGRYVVGVRNKTVPSLIHLVNFDHDLVSHGHRVGVVHGTSFVDKVQEKGQQKFSEEAERILNE